MERKANKMDWQAGRQAEKKKDDCGCNPGCFKVISKKLLAIRDPSKP